MLAMAWPQKHAQTLQSAAAEHVAMLQCVARLGSGPAHAEAAAALSESRSSFSARRSRPC